MQQYALILAGNDEMVHRAAGSMKDTVFRFFKADDFQAAMHLLTREHFDLIIIQIDPPWMPNVQGVFPLRWMSEAAVLVLSHYKPDAICYSIADECLHWPMEASELPTRARAAIRHRSMAFTGDEPNQYLFCRGLALFPVYRRVFYCNNEVGLSFIEYELLYYLMLNRDQSLSRDQILEHVWRQKIEIEDDTTVNTHIYRIRKKLALLTNEVFLETVYGVGYRFSTLPFQLPGQMTLEDYPINNVLI